MDKGILVASDKHGEWLLDWWWENYSRDNSYPVAFVNFGMSKERLKWCNEKGQVIEFAFLLSTGSNEEILRKAESLYGKEIHQTRNSWFKKPLALTLTPFKQTLWLDTDCEVLGPLSPLFKYNNLALAKTGAGSDEYNSGVIVFQKNDPIITEWAEAAKRDSSLYVGDQDLLSHMIFNKQLKVTELPLECNWNISRGLNTNALIMHWSGTWGKSIIKDFGGIHKTLQNLPAVIKEWSERQGIYHTENQIATHAESNGKFFIKFQNERPWIQKDTPYELIPLANSIALIKLEENALTFLQYTMNNTFLIFDMPFKKINSIKR